jgi:hypothetical protein
MRLLQEKELTRLQPERQQVAVAVGARQLLEEAEVAASQVAEVLVQLLMLRTMGEQKARPIPIELEDDRMLGEIDSTYLRYHKPLLKRHPQPNMTTQCTLSITTMMEQDILSERQGKRTHMSTQRWLL